MRISDWSSDVCCSDLVFEILAALLHGPPERRGDFAPVIAEEPERPFRGDGRIKLAQGPGGRIARIHRHADAGRRQSLGLALRHKIFLHGPQCEEVLARPINLTADFQHPRPALAVPPDLGRAPEWERGCYYG